MGKLYWEGRWPAYNIMAVDPCVQQVVVNCYTTCKGSKGEVDETQACRTVQVVCRGFFPLDAA